MPCNFKKSVHLATLLWRFIKSFRFQHRNNTITWTIIWWVMIYVAKFWYFSFSSCLCLPWYLCYSLPSAAVPQVSFRPPRVLSADCQIYTLTREAAAVATLGWNLSVNWSVNCTSVARANLRLWGKSCSPTRLSPVMMVLRLGELIILILIKIEGKSESIWKVSYRML